MEGNPHQFDFNKFFCYKFTICVFKFLIAHCDFTNFLIED